jgi:hypothetical protein
MAGAAAAAPAADNGVMWFGLIGTAHFLHWLA